ncbi:MAG: hypothetical protein DMG65_23575 [Candidatus Angelobacter sp. Gp1-AA117]|nr:MAG: hypothetical protein DMG65_23575 [Candidatus Angelobacter sp. Gp1-AA117]
MTFDYEGWLKTAEERLETLYEQKAAIEEEINKLEEGIRGFAPLVKRSNVWFGPEAGLTDAIRAILKLEPSRCYSATAMRDELLNRGTSLTQKNPMAAIHQTLARLVDRGEAKIHTFSPGHNLYQFAEKTDESAEKIKSSRMTGVRAGLERLRKTDKK